VLIDISRGPFSSVFQKAALTLAEFERWSRATRAGTSATGNSGRGSRGGAFGGGDELVDFSGHQVFTVVHHFVQC
jgi:hypothetical protein